MHLASDKASELFGSAVQGFRSGHNSDVEKSMQKAAREALVHLKAEAPPGFDDWFSDWQSYLAFQPAIEVFAGARDLNPGALNYDDDQFRDLWWSRMELVLVGWRKAETSGITQLHLDTHFRMLVVERLRMSTQAASIRPRGCGLQRYGVAASIPREVAKPSNLTRNAHSDKVAPRISRRLPTQAVNDKGRSHQQLHVRLSRGVELRA